MRQLINGCQRKKIKMLSIVIPIYNEAENPVLLYQKIKEVAPLLEKHYEIIFIDDGSKDNSFKILKDISKKDEHIRIVKLTKNYGQDYALLAGFRHTQGEIVITMDCDLQNDPVDILKLLKKMEEGYDIVSGFRENRKDSAFRRVLSKFANKIIALRTKVVLKDYGCALCAVKKPLLEELEHYGKKARFIKPLLVTFTDAVGEVAVSHNLRITGGSKYSFLKIFRWGVDFIVNFRLLSNKSASLYILEETLI